ncbi:MAG: hypothetical protein PHG02_06350 [Oscillospiraceae bacterium]|nr:hypothetical protein [Oscillospiraceae bacterium]
MEFNWINFFGLGIVSVMMIPNIFYAVKYPTAKNKCKNKIINAVEQIGRYGAFALMFFPLGVWKFKFFSATDFLVYVFANVSLLLIYLLAWVFYFGKATLPKALVLAVVPCGIFFLSGVMLKHWLLVAASLLFAVGHIYITYKNNKN